MAQRRIRPILDLTKHGASGYARGCGCPACRAGHARKAQEWRAKRRRARDLAELDEVARAQAVMDATPPARDESQAQGLLDATLPAGLIEQAVEFDLARLVGEPPWKATLSALARANARIVDQAVVHQQLGVLSGVQLRLLDILDRLRRTAEPSGAGAPADLAGLLGEPDD